MGQHSYSSVRKNGHPEQQYTPPAIPIPVVIEVPGPATILRELKQKLQQGQPDLTERIEQLHAAYSERIITFWEYWEEMQGLWGSYRRE